MFYDGIQKKIMFFEEIFSASGAGFMVFSNIFLKKA